MRDDSIVHMLKEQRRIVQSIKRDSVWKLDQVELFFLRQDLVDVGFEKRVGLENLGADAPLYRGFNLRLRPGC